MLGRRGAASVWAIALLVLAVSGCSGAATTVTGKTFGQRIGTGVRKLYDRLINRKGNFPGLERKPGTTAITDPANMESDNPAIQEAAQVKAEEDQAAQKIKAIKYLGTIGCGCHPDVRDALFAALDDCTADVRYAAAKAFETAANSACSACNTKSCCDREVLLKLWKMGYEKKKGSTCWLEPSPRVRSAARAAFAACKKNCLPPPEPTDAPDEGPEADPEAAEAAAEEAGDAEASTKSTGGATKTASRSRGVEAAGGVFYVPGARLLAGGKQPTAVKAAQGDELPAGAPPRPTGAEVVQDGSTLDDLHGQAIPTRPDLDPSLRNAPAGPRSTVATQSSANAPVSLDGPGPSAADRRGPTNDAAAFGPPPGASPRETVASLNAPAQPIQEPRLTAEQLEMRRRALQSAVYNQQVEAELARQREHEAAQERQALAWKQEQERREQERLQRMAAQPSSDDFGAASPAPAAPTGPSFPTPNAPASLGSPAPVATAANGSPNPASAPNAGPIARRPDGVPAAMPTLVAPGGPLNTLPTASTQFAAQQNPAAAPPTRAPLDPAAQARLDQETANRERMLRERAAAIEAARQREIAAQTRAPESDREARERWIREHEENERVERERAAKLQEARRQLAGVAGPERTPGVNAVERTPGLAERIPATTDGPAPGVVRPASGLQPPPWQQGRIAAVDAAGGSLQVVFPKSAPATMVGKQVDVFQRVDGRWVLMGKAEVVGVQGEGVVARPLGPMNLQQVTTSDYVFYRTSGSAEPPR